MSGRRGINPLFLVEFILLALCVNCLPVVCADFRYAVAQENFEKNFQRTFEAQLDLIENQNLGCLYDPDVCSSEENCFNDGLFGTCIAGYADEVSFSYRLPQQLQRDLKAILATLVTENYTWHDRYTQCCVRAAMICASMEIPTDLTVCRDFVIERIATHEKVSLPPQTKDESSIAPSSKGRLTGILQVQQKQQQITKRGRDLYWDEFAKRFELLNRHKYIFNNQDDEEDSNGQDRSDDEAAREAEDHDDARRAVWRFFEDIPGTRDIDISRDKSAATRPKHRQKLHRQYNKIEQEQTQQRHHDQQQQKQHRPMKSMSLSQKDSGRASYKKLSQKLDLQKRQRVTPTKVAGVQNIIDGSYLWVKFKKPGMVRDAARFIQTINRVARKSILGDRFFVNITNNEVYFQLAPMASPEDVRKLLENKTTAGDIKSDSKFEWTNYGFDQPQNRVAASELNEARSQHKEQIITLVLCGLVLVLIAAMFVVFVVQRTRSSKKKLREMTASSAAGGNADYRDLCRQRMLEKSAEQHEPVSAAAQLIASARPAASDSPNSSTGSWSDDPIPTDMDITTGHLILSYMEEFLNNKEKLEEEWASLCSYEADRTSTDVAKSAANTTKNRYPDRLPYDHSRVVLNKELNVSAADYINASFISDSDPKVKSYILTQGPTDETAADFWQMLWECCSVTVVNLTKLKSADGLVDLCTQYWPAEGSRLFNRFEVHLVSEHIWCDSFVVRNFYLKNLATGEARTVTMFHFLSWDEAGLPPSPKSLLDFRRKVNKSYKGRASPLVIHCNDGTGRSGAYCLLDLALSRINKGVKEIDLAACLEHLRDQRPGLVRTKEQFEFVVTAIAEEVHNVLKTLPQ